MEKRRIDKKRVALNILTVLGIVILVLLVVYVLYIVRMQSGETIPMSDLTGRLYASDSGDVQLRFYTEDEFLFRDGEERKTFRTYEYKDGILVFREEGAEEQYTFLLLTEERLFYDNGREVLYLVWYE